jgi:quercetin dioxygenase-like cupin family protein
MVLTLDDEPHRVKAGEIFMIPAGHVHSVKAESNFKMIITMVAAERKVTFEHQHNK